MAAQNSFALAQLTVGSLEDVGHEIRLMSVVEGGYREAELVGQANESVNVDGFVAMRLDLGNSLFCSSPQLRTAGPTFTRPRRTSTRASHWRFSGYD